MFRFFLFFLVLKENQSDLSREAPTVLIFRFIRVGVYTVDLQNKIANLREQIQKLREQ
jgi:hypothetical protein